MKKHSNKNGRPLKITKDVLSKLEEYFMKGLSDEKACFMAGIHPNTLYRFMEKYPDYRERKESLKTRPDIDAQITIVDSIKTNVSVAQWWITKRVPEFKDTVKVDNTLVVEHKLSPALEAAAEAYRMTRRAEIINNIKAIPV